MFTEYIDLCVNKIPGGHTPQIKNINTHLDLMRLLGPVTKSQLSFIHESPYKIEITFKADFQRKRFKF